MTLRRNLQSARRSVRCNAAFVRNMAAPTEVSLAVDANLDYRVILLGFFP